MRQQQPERLELDAQSAYIRSRRWNPEFLLAF